MHQRVVMRASVFAATNRMRCCLLRTPRRSASTLLAASNATTNVALDDAAAAHNERLINQVRTAAQQLASRAGSDSSKWKVVLDQGVPTSVAFNKVTPTVRVVCAANQAAAQAEQLQQRAVASRAHAKVMERIATRRLAVKVGANDICLPALPLISRFVRVAAAVRSHADYGLADVVAVADRARRQDLCDRGRQLPVCGANA